MNFTLHQLEIFVKVCDCQSITKAAEKMFLTQPAISIQLKKLQNEFEIPLTEVIGRQLFVTDFGRRIYDLSREILAGVAAINTATDEYKGIMTGEIRIATASTGKYVLPFFLRDFMHNHPGVKVDIDVTNKTKVVESLKENAVDFALISVLPTKLNLHAFPLIKNENYLVAAADYPKLPKQMSVEKLANYPLIFREHGSATRSVMQNFLKANNVQVKRSMTMVSNEAVKQAVLAGLGLSIMPIIGIRAAINSGDIMRIPIKGLPHITEWNLVYMNGKKLSIAAKALLAHIEANKQQISEKYFIEAIT